MTGVLLTDFYMMRRQLALCGAIAAAYLAIGIANHSGWSLMTFLVVCSAILPMNTFTYSDQCHWDRYLNTLPVRRRDYVNAKFLFVLLLGGAGMLLGVSAILLDNVLHQEAPLNFVEYALFAGLGGLVYASVFMALIIKMSVERARVFMIALLFIPATIFLILPRTGLDLDPLLKILQLPAFVPTIILAALAIIIIAYLLSQKFYRQKEL